MSGKSSSAVTWFTLLEPAPPPRDLVRRTDDPRLGELIDFWRGAAAELRPGRAVLVGFPQDEGIRRNLGRSGAALAPRRIRHWLHRLTPWDNFDPPLDAGDLRIHGSLEESQDDLATVVAGILGAAALPIVLGGGHETAYGSFLGYVAAQQTPALINLDAHLDVRPFAAGAGHSGSPFRQALEHPRNPLPGTHYVCLGAQPHAVSREHLRYVQDRGGVVRWADETAGSLDAHLLEEIERVRPAPVHVSIDADVVRTADVPGVSAPNAVGLSGKEVIGCARRAGESPRVSGLDLVEISPPFDRDDQSSRWAALVVWHFLSGLTRRTKNLQ